MIKTIFTLLLIIGDNSLLAQHIQYRDKPKTKPVPLPKTKDSVVYHIWPDRCPALTGAVPVLTNYVPHAIVLKVTEVYEGHLYSITSIKVVGDKFEYRLKVCVKGVIRYDVADENGVIIKKG